MFSIERNQKKKYAVLKNNVHLLKVKNKKAQDKIQYRNNEIKELSKHYLYSQNDFISLRDVLPLPSPAFIGKAMIAMSAAMVAVQTRKTIRKNKVAQIENTNENADEKQLV